MQNSAHSDQSAVKHSAQTYLPRQSREQVGTGSKTNQSIQHRGMVAILLRTLFSSICQKKAAVSLLQMAVYKVNGATENSASEAQCSLGFATLMISES